jgi:predicted phosphodiesterase
VIVAVISDIHGNRHALEAVLDHVSETECEELWCLGDLVGYGAEPDACVELMRAHAAVCLAGNHDLGVTGEIDLENFSDIAREAAEWTRQAISTGSREYLQSLDSSNENEAVGLYHASPRDPVWEYVLSPLQAELCFDTQPHRIALIGHTHVALSFHRADGGSATGETRRDGEILELAEGHWLLNPGSVGQPRDGDPRAGWLELDLDNWTAAFRRTNYDIEGAAWEIRAARLPDQLAERLSHGQ